VSGRRIRLSASSRVLLAMAVMLGLAIGTLVVVAYGATVRTLTYSLDQTLLKEAEAYSAAMKGAPTDAALIDATRVYLSARTGSESGGVTPILLVRFSNGRVISNSAVRIEDAAGNPTTATASPTYRMVTLDADRYRVFATPIETGGERVGVFESALAEGPIQSTASGIAATLTAAGLIVLALALPVSYFATRRALAPLRRMADDAEAISHAQPGRRIVYRGPKDELGSLAASLNAMLARLEHAFADQRRFVADASHELRTPVAVVRGNVELLMSGRASGDEAEESLTMIEHESVRMSRLLDELLALARLEESGRAQFQPLDVRTLLEEVAARGRALGDRVIAISGPCDLWVSGDPDLLDQALVNIVRNSVAHTHPQGRIELGCTLADSMVRICVTDDGPGIPEADLDRVFDRFYRAQSARRDTTSGGAGLGLAITQRLVQLHGGTIHAENVAPHGARFVIELPRVDEPA